MQLYVEKKQNFSAFQMPFHLKKTINCLFCRLQLRKTIGQYIGHTSNSEEKCNLSSRQHAFCVGFWFEQRPIRMITVLLHWHPLLKQWVRSSTKPLSVHRCKTSLCRFRMDVHFVTSFTTTTRVCCLSSLSVRTPLRLWRAHWGVV